MSDGEPSRCTYVHPPFWKRYALANRGSLLAACCPCALMAPATIIASTAAAAAAKSLYLMNSFSAPDLRSNHRPQFYATHPPHCASFCNRLAPGAFPRPARRFRANISPATSVEDSMKVSRVLNFALVLACCLAAGAQDSPLQRHVSALVPAQGSSRALSADRPQVPSLPAAAPLQAPAAHNWQLQATLPGSVIHDIAFASPLVGYAVAEGGLVYKTSNGGTTWDLILNLGYPYYFYGVDAVTADNVV